MRTITTAFAAVTITVLCGLGVQASRDALGAFPGNSSRVVEVMGDRPGAWVFVRQGCPHCAAHLDALGRAVAGLPAAERRATLARIHVCGWPERAPSGAVAEADSLARRAGVHLVPTTYFIGAGGAIERVWRGARGTSVWGRALRGLDRKGTS